MAIYQRQPLKLHHGIIQRKKHDAKDNECGGERQQISFHAVMPSGTIQRKRSRQSEPTQTRPALPKGTWLFRLHVSCLHQHSCLHPLGYLQDQEVQDQADEDDIHQHPGKNDHIRVIFFVQIFHSGRVPYLPLQSQSLRIYFTRPSTSSVVRVEPQWGINADLLMDGPPSLMTPLRSSSERFSISEELVKLRGSVAKSFVTLMPLPLPSIPWHWAQ